LLEEVERVSASVVILEAGRVVADGGISGLQQTAPELVVELESESQPEPALALASALERAGLSVTTDGPKRAIVVLDSPSVYDTVRDVLADGGFSVRRLERRTASLEEIYLASAGSGRT